MRPLGIGHVCLRREGFGCCGDADRGPRGCGRRMARRAPGRVVRERARPRPCPERHTPVAVVTGV
ncbi:hypothetical protein DA2_3009 [Desulfovibrio sp. A2]|nr:hypothetical protein DA2_3009 [Desulfovibrio sp. A2]